MMRTVGFLLVRGVMWLTVASTATACGGGGGEKKEKPKPAAKAAEEAPAQVNKVEGVLGENAKWKPVKGLFEAYTQREIAGVTDYSLDNTTLFIEKPIIQDSGLDETKAAEEAPKPVLDPTNCATKFSIDSYKVILLMTGIAQPKAVMVDGNNDRCEVMRGEALGNEGGRVTAITQYKVVVLVPGKEKPVVLSIAPPISVDDETQDDEGALP